MCQATALAILEIFSYTKKYGIISTKYTKKEMTLRTTITFYTFYILIKEYAFPFFINAYFRRRPIMK
jgi:hypothetical protein